MWYLRTPGLALRSVNLAYKMHIRVNKIKGFFRMLFMFTGHVSLQKCVEHRTQTVSCFSRWNYARIRYTNHSVEFNEVKTNPVLHE